MFEVKFDKKAENFLLKCESELFDRIIKKLEILKQNPVPYDSKRVLGYELPTFRIRIGKYRVLYRVNYETKLVIVINIDKRERVYD